MNNWSEIKTVGLATIIILVLDAIYLTSTSAILVPQITKIQNAPVQFRLLGAILCYICLVGGIYYFILREHRPIFDAFLLGIVIYGVYEFTNYAILKQWKWEIVVMDTLWGGILMALTTFFVYKIMR
jgi:uncharacterized membrane protein